MITQLRFGNAQPIFGWQRLRTAERASAGNDRHLVNAMSTGKLPGENRMPGLVVGRFLLFFTGQNLLAFRSHQNLVARVLEVGHFDDGLVVARRPERGLVDDIANVRAGQADGAGGENLQVHVFG